MNKPSKYFKRFSRFLFPFRRCPLPEVKGDTNIVVIHTEARMSCLDRLRILFSGRVTMCVKAQADDPTNINMQFNVLPPAHWQTDEEVHPTRVITYHKNEPAN